jgi:catechol 2,3-dioxygenase-like lactoylglutathione lyase family enzyme
MHRALAVLCLALPLAAHAETPPLALSHLFIHVEDTDATIEFWVSALGGEVESDEELMAPAFDGIFGRVGVKIRTTFIRVGGIRLHTIETLDVPRKFEEERPTLPQLGMGGVSFEVEDLDAAHARAEREGRSPTPIHEFEDIEEPVRMFFLSSPNRVRVEMIGKAD